MDELVQQKLNLFFAKYKQQSYKKGELLLKADEEPSAVFYLVDGIVNMYAVSQNGEELSINTFKPSAFFPMSWVLNDKIPQHYYEAKTDCTVFKSPKEDFLQFLKEEPEIVFNLMKRIYNGLDGYFLRMEYLMSGSAKNRLITELLIIAKRFGKVIDNKIETEIKLTETDLAAQTGMARETISRELQKLKEKNLISIENKKLIINNSEELEAELNN